MQEKAKNIVSQISLDRISTTEIGEGELPGVKGKRAHCTPYTDINTWKPSSTPTIANGYGTAKKCQDRLSGRGWLMVTATA